GRREDAFGHQPSAQFDAGRVVDVQDRDGRSPDRRSADEVSAGPAKVPSPLLTARVEERREFARQRVSPRDVRPLVRVAMEATQGEVGGGCAAAVLPGDDVIDLERTFVEVLGHATVFAAGQATLPD